MEIVTGEDARTTYFEIMNNWIDSDKHGPPHVSGFYYDNNDNSWNAYTNTEKRLVNNRFNNEADACEWLFNFIGTPHVKDLKYRCGDFIAGYNEHPVNALVMGIITSIEVYEEEEYESNYLVHALKPPTDFYDQNELDNSAFIIGESAVEYWKPKAELSTYKEQYHKKLDDIYQKIWEMKKLLDAENHPYNLDKAGIDQHLGGIMCDIDHIQSEFLTH